MNDTGRMVVVGVDGSPDGSAALAWASDFARRYDADLKIVAAWEFPTTAGAGAMVYDADEPERAATTALAKARTDLDYPKERVHGVIAQGRPGKVLVKASGDALALVVGSQGHGAIAEMMLGSVSAYCVRHAHCPVVVVR